MNKLLNLTAEPRQSNMYDFNGRKIIVDLYYSEVNAGWYISIQDDDFKLINARLTCNYNYVNKWRRKLKWGLQVISKDGIDPYGIEDLASGKVELYFLTPEEVDYITNFVLRDHAELLEKNAEIVSFL